MLLNELIQDSVMIINKSMIGLNVNLKNVCVDDKNHGLFALAAYLESNSKEPGIEKLVEAGKIGEAVEQIKMLSAGYKKTASTLKEFSSRLDGQMRHYYSKTAIDTDLVDPAFHSRVLKYRDFVKDNDALVMDIMHAAILKIADQHSIDSLNIMFILNEAHEYQNEQNEYVNIESLIDHIKEYWETKKSSVDASYETLSELAKDAEFKIAGTIKAVDELLVKPMSDTLKNAKKNFMSKLNENIESMKDSGVRK